MPRKRSAGAIVLENQRTIQQKHSKEWQQYKLYYNKSIGGECPLNFLEANRWHLRRAHHGGTIGRYENLQDKESLRILE